MTFYDGYQFLFNKVIWTCHTLNGRGQVYEPMWMCVSDDNQIRNFGISEIALYPQVMTGPAFRPTDTAGDHPGEPGTRGRYIKGCRCDQCKAENAAYVKRWRRTRGV